MRNNGIGSLRTSLFLMSAALMLILSCAFVDRTAKVGMKRDVYTKQLSTSKTLYMGDVWEKSPSLRQGIVKNGYGWETANVYTETSPVEFIKQTLAKELSRYGYRVIDAGKSKSKYPRISIEVFQAFCEPYLAWTYINYDAVVEVEITLEMGRGKAYKRRVKGIGRHRATDSCGMPKTLCIECNYEDSYAMALEDFVKKSVPAIAEMVK